jgi:hypothetical protein
MQSRGKGTLVKSLLAKELFTKQEVPMRVGKPCSYMRDPNNPGSFVLTFDSGSGSTKSAYIARLDAVNFHDHVST